MARESNKNPFTPFRRKLHEAEIELDYLLTHIPVGFDEQFITDLMLELNNILNNVPNQSFK